MYPKYKNFHEDLNRFNNKITELYYNFKKLKLEDMSAKEREDAELLQYKFDTIQKYIYNLLKENPGNDEDVERLKSWSWKQLSTDIRYLQEHGLTNLYYANDVSEDDVLAGLYDNLGSDKSRYMFDIYKRIVLFSSDLEAMNNRADYFEAQDNVDAYMALCREREEELKGFTDVIPFRSYADLLDAKERAAREFHDAKSNYENYKDGKLVADALDKYNKKKAEYEDIKNGCLGVMSILGNQKSELETQLQEAKDGLKREQEILKNYEKTSARYRAKFDELADKEETLNKEMEQLRTLHYQLMDQKNDTLAMLDDVKTEFQGYESGRAKQGEDANFAVLRSDFVKLLREGSDIKALRDELDEKLNAIGYLTMDADKKVRTFKEGKMLDNLNDEILKLYKESNLKGVFENIDFKNSVIKIYDEMTDKYVASLKLDAQQRKEFYAKVNSLGKLREHMKNHNSRISNDIEACTAGTYKNKALSIDKKHMAEYGKSLKDLYSKWFDAEQRKASLDVMQAAITANGEKFSTLEAELREVKDETARQQKLFTGESRPQHIAEFTEAIETLPKKIHEKELEFNKVQRQYFQAESERKDAIAEYNAVVERSQNAKERLERTNKAYQVIRSYVDKVDSFCETTQKVEEERGKLTAKLKLDDNMRNREDFWKTTREAIDEEVREFFVTANVGKRAGHTNSDEFEQMRSSLYYLSGASEEDRAGVNALTPEEFIKRLVIVKSAAADYLQKKSEQTFVWGTTMRKTRLDYANRLVDFANRKLVDIMEMVQKNNELNEKLASAKLAEPLYGDNPTKIMNEIINKPILKRRKAEEEKKLADQRRKEGLERQKQNPQPVKDGPVLG